MEGARAYAVQICRQRFAVKASAIGMAVLAPKLTSSSADAGHS